MRFTEVFIRRPLLGGVLNALILVFGVVSFSALSLRPYPYVEGAGVSVSTSYPGASADVVQGFITGPIQRAVVSAEGIDYYTSDSRDGSSVISIYVAKGHDTDQVMMSVIAQVAAVRSELPPNALEPVISKMPSDTPTVWIQITDPQMTAEQITEFYYRVLRPRLFIVEGAAGLRAIGERPFSMRLWLDPLRMAAVGVTTADVEQAVRANNFISEAGEVRDQLVVQPVRAATDINTAGAFADIVIRQHGGAVVRLRDVATVELTSEPDYRRGFVDGLPALLVGVNMTPESNPLVLSRGVRRVVAELQDQLPPTMEMKVFYDLGDFISVALGEVTKTLFEALAIVAVITLLFFGNPRAVLIMLISIPLSLVGTFLIMWMLGYSLNLFTLLALVIAIGLVVDDTIVVVENIHRHIEQGQSPFEAALTGTREVTGPVIAMSLTLVAVFLPVGFMEGLSGELIAEFVFTLAGSVAISGIIALTLSPVLSSRILKPEREHSIAHWLDERFEVLRCRYAAALGHSLRYRALWLMAAMVVIGSIPALFLLSERELVPLEDTGFVHMSLSVAPHLSDEYVSEKGARLDDMYRRLPGYSGSMRFEGMVERGTAVSVVGFVPWEQRDFTVMEMSRIIQEKVNAIPGIEAHVFIVDISPASIAGQVPIQLAIRTTDDYRRLAEVSERFLQDLRSSGKFLFAASDLKYSRPQIVVDIDRHKAAELGVSMADVATTLGAMLSEGYINRFSYEGESYKVIPQTSLSQRFDRTWLGRYHVRTASGATVPLGALVETRLASRPNSLRQFNGLNTATFSLVMAPGVSMDEALDFLEQESGATLPAGYSIDYSGKARSFLQAGNSLLIAFTLALLLIYLFLVAQFESLRDPLVVMVTVPMSISGALVFLCLDLATLSLFSQVGLITLIGLISKHGILMVDLARRLQEAGRSLQEAIVEAASVRLRPVLMTTAAIVMAVGPLLLASGPGAVARNHIGLVIAAGMTIGTLFTLFVLPVVYTYIGERREPVAGGMAAEPAARSMPVHPG